MSVALEGSVESIIYWTSILLYQIPFELLLFKIILEYFHKKGFVIVEEMFKVPKCEKVLP